MEAAPGRGPRQRGDGIEGRRRAGQARGQLGAHARQALGRLRQRARGHRGIVGGRHDPVQAPFARGDGHGAETRRAGLPAGDAVGDHEMLDQQRGPLGAVGSHARGRPGGGNGDRRGHQRRGGQAEAAAAASPRN